MIGLEALDEKKVAGGSVQLTLCYEQLNGTLGKLTKEINLKSAETWIANEQLNVSSSEGMGHALALQQYVSVVKEVVQVALLDSADYVDIPKEFLQFWKDMEGMYDVQKQSAMLMKVNEALKAKAGMERAEKNKPVPFAWRLN